jgi:hypothetical protein
MAEFVKDVSIKDPSTRLCGNFQYALVNAIATGTGTHASTHQLNKKIVRLIKKVFLNETLKEL